MFIMDVPSIPAQETPIVLAQTTPSEGGQPDYIFKDCQETENGGDPRSAMRSVDPAGMLAVYLGNQRNRDIYDNQTAMASIKVTMLQGTAHGKITTEIDNTGRTSYGYDPISNYQGNDKAIFMTEFEGKRYKIVVELHVFMDVAPGDFGASTCPPPQLIKVTKPSSGDTGYGDGYNISPVSITFADLAGAALGQTTGTTITLDTNK